jgi:transcriptional regulatory protein RtcR
LDLFDRLQLLEVVRVCRASRSLAEAGRVLFDKSRQQKTSVNDSHRLKQYLQKFGLTFQILDRGK